MTASYNAIIIGSGAGGPIAAVALAQARKKVLVLEQHDRPGGWTHSFTLEGYRFSPGVPFDKLRTGITSVICMRVAGCIAFTRGSAFRKT